MIAPRPSWQPPSDAAPDGTLITPASGPSGANSQFVLTQYASYYRCALPVLPANASGSHEGLWHAVLKLGKRIRGSYTYDPGTHNVKGSVVPYEFVAHSYSSLTFSAHVSQASFEIGATANISASLLEYDAVPRGRASVWAEIRRPDGVFETIGLSAGPEGRYTVSYGLPIPGVYIIRVRARGETMHGIPFEREKTLTVVAVPGGDRWDPNDPNRDPICELLDCLRRTGAINNEFIRRLRELGIDLPAFLKCFERKCLGTSSAIETRERQTGLARTNPSLTTFSLEQLIELITEAVNQSLNRSINQ